MEIDDGGQAKPAPPDALSALTLARLALHASLLKSKVLTISSGNIPSIADKDNKTSVEIAKGIITRLKGEVGTERLAGQTGGKGLEDAIRDFLNDALPTLSDLLPGQFRAERHVSIFEFYQYQHLKNNAAYLKALEALIPDDPEVEIAAFGGDYMVAPDVVVTRAGISDDELNSSANIADTASHPRATLRGAERRILHASVSCKLTIRSDRSQNSRLEALNLIRNRRGRAPHIVVVTAEPLPSRIASIATGTGDFDCIYHIALEELVASADFAIAAGRAANARSQTVVSREEQRRLLTVMIRTNRLKDVSDLPLDLVL